MRPPLNVLIVEDDFRVAEITEKYVNSLDGFQTAASAKTAAEATLAAEQQSIHIVLLDVYIPDTQEMQLFHELQQKLPDAALIMLTAAREQEIVRRALLGGAVDYLLKPVDFERLSAGLYRAARWLTILYGEEEISQQQIDHLLQLPAAGGAKEDLPKGIDPITLEQILDLLKREKGVTAVEAGEAIGASRSTARRYLEYLTAEGKAEALLKYGDVGRPERRYIHS
jgi:response regulator of citrate/malate metabolism